MLLMGIKKLRLFKWLYLTILVFVVIYGIYPNIYHDKNKDCNHGKKRTSRKDDAPLYICPSYDTLPFGNPSVLFTTLRTKISFQVG